MSKLSDLRTFQTLQESHFRQAWAAVGITDYPRAIREWEARPKTVVPEHHPFRKLVSIAESPQFVQNVNRKPRADEPLDIPDTWGYGVTHEPKIQER